MRIGLVFPRNDIGTDPGAIREFAVAAEDLGFSHISIEEHVLGVDPDREGGWHLSPYGVQSTSYIDKDMPFSEPLVLSGFLAAVTRRIEMNTCILILPQRQAALVAKQVAEVAILSEGRFRLGIGGGWNSVEFEGLGAEFKDRGKRQEEQVHLMRELWTKGTVDFTGRFHRIDKAGINPLPGYDIPIWFGGNADIVLKRAARIGDGWIPLGMRLDDEWKAMLQRLKGYLADEGRDPGSFGIDVPIRVQDGGPEALRAQVDGYADLGATHISIHLGRPERRPVTMIIEELRGYRDALAGLMG